MFKITVKVTNKTIPCNNIRDVQSLLKQYPDATLMDGTDIFNPQEKSLYQWLRGRENIFLLFNLWKLKDSDCIKDVDLAFIFIKSEYWNGNTDIFNKELLERIDICISIVQSPRWNGSCSNFGKEPMSDFDFCTYIMTLRRWNGSFENFNTNLLKSSKFYTHMLLLGKWNSKINDMN